jgi:hypothetical protein
MELDDGINDTSYHEHKDEMTSLMPSESSLRLVRGFDFTRAALTLYWGGSMAASATTFFRE